MAKKFKPCSLLYIIPVTILLVAVIYNVVQALRIYIPQEKAQKDFEKLKENAGITTVSAADPKIEPQKKAESELDVELQESYQSLSDENNDYVGWLSIDDTIIDYPVMKSPESDPEFYLHRDFYKNDSLIGSLFIGAGCNADSNSFIIYGHNMNNGSMFAELDKYSNYDFALEHKDIVFDTLKERRVYRVFASFQTKVYSEEEKVFKYYEAIGKLDKKQHKDVVDNVRKLSFIEMSDIPEYPKQILFLSTCSYHTDDGRFVVAAYRIK